MWVRHCSPSAEQVRLWPSGAVCCWQDEGHPVLTLSVVSLVCLGHKLFSGKDCLMWHVLSSISPFWSLTVIVIKRDDNICTWKAGVGIPVVCGVFFNNFVILPLSPCQWSLKKAWKLCRERELTWVLRHCACLSCSISSFIVVCLLLKLLAFS